MSIQLFLSNYWFRLRRQRYTRRFEKSCQAVGPGLQVKGPFRLRNDGQVFIGEKCLIDSSKERPIRIDVGNQASLSLGNRVYINEGVFIACNISVKIGDRCLIASDVSIIDDDGHPVDWQKRHDHWPVLPQDRLGAPVVIEDNVWIGTRAIILKGVHIGEGSVVAAGAVVTRSVRPGILVGGVPAKKIREI